jgi:hypothetical protein
VKIQCERNNACYRPAGYIYLESRLHQSPPAQRPDRGGQRRKMSINHPVIKHP